MSVFGPNGPASECPTSVPKGHLKVEGEVSIAKDSSGA